MALHRKNAAENVWIDRVETPDGALAGHRCIVLSIVYMQRWTLALNGVKV